MQAQKNGLVRITFSDLVDAIAKNANGFLGRFFGADAHFQFGQHQVRPRVLGGGFNGPLEERRCLFGVFLFELVSGRISQNGRRRKVLWLLAR